MSSFFIPLGALNASSTALAMVGNNLANLNTTGYKASVASFSDLVSEQIGTGSTTSQIGMGVADPIVRHQFVQGSVQGTSGPLDAAIQGDGFFVVRGENGATSYTRAGNFHLDGNGNLVNANSEFVQGWSAVGGAVNANGAVSNISIPAGSLQSPIATTKMSVNVNLDANAATDATFSTPIEIVDSLGGTHTATITFKKTGANAWSYDVSIPGQDVGTAVTPPATTPAKSLKTGTLTFDGSGKLATPAIATGSVDLPITGLTNGAADQTITWNLYGSDLASTLTQYTQASAASGSTQDGAIAAQPTKISLGDGGTIVAQYSNGKKAVVAQIALAAIRNPDSMLAVGGNNFQLGADTVTPTIGTAATGGRGKIMASALEGSTVDIAKEFTDLMVYQRSYQANSKVITTLDELSQATLAIKR